jgi:hypothetical protein
MNQNIVKRSQDRAGHSKGKTDVLAEPQLAIQFE